MIYSPDSNIKLLNTPFTIDQEHVLQFGNLQEQATYFSGCPSYNITDSTYQRKDNAIRVGINIDSIQTFNYVMYKNSHFTNKWFYAFITKMEYINENLTLIYIKTDVFQTWFFNLTFNKSFVERQHESTDEYNTLSDTPATGQLVEFASKEFNFDGGYFVFCTTDITQDDTKMSQPYSFKIGNYSVPCLVLYWSEANAGLMASVMQNIASHGWGDRVLASIYIPYVGDTASLQLHNVVVDALGGYIDICQGYNTVASLTEELTFDYSGMPGLTFKSLTHPYAKIIVTDMTTGQSIELAPEKFASYPPKFKVQTSICETPSYKIIPMNYCGQLLAYNQALTTRCNTSLPVANNAYAKYMMMNGEMNTLKNAGSAVGMVGSAMSGSAMGVMTGAQAIMTTIAQENQASKLPNQITAFTDGAMDRILFQNGIKIALMTMDSFHQAIADSYWRTYGYPIRKVMIPTLNDGGTFDYVKLISPNIVGGDVPQEDMLEIENIFTKGVTLWHFASTFRQY